MARKPGGQRRGWLWFTTIAAFSLLLGQGAEESGTPTQAFTRPPFLEDDKPALLDDDEPLLLDEEPLLLLDEAEPALLLDEAEPLLLLDKEEPLLLLNDGTGINASAKPMADNSRCQVCHLNIVLEEISLIHAKANISCVKCHGQCDEHIADESWASGGNGTPPELMYPKHNINFMCRECHKEPAMLSRNAENPCPKLAGVRTRQRVCTDCHGKHRAVNRKCKWK